MISDLEEGNSKSVLRLIRARGSKDTIRVIRGSFASRHVDTG